MFPLRPLSGWWGDALATMGHRVLAVAAGPDADMRVAGFVALTDLPRPESAALIGELRD